MIQKTGAISLKKFITDNFSIPDNDLQGICEFINNDLELEKIIFQLPSLIQREIPYDKLQIRFYDEFQNEYLQLEVSIFTSMDILSSLKIEEKLEQQLYEFFDSNSADKLLMIMESYQ